MYKVPTQIVQRLCRTTAKRQTTFTQCGCTRLGTISLLQSNVQDYRTANNCSFSSTARTHADPSKSNATNAQGLNESSPDASAEELLRGSQVHDIDPEFPSDVTEKWGKYKNYNDWARSQTRHAFRPRIDPKHMSIIIFPGQGAQFVGMASKLLDYPNVGEMFKVASEVLQYDLLDVCLNGPKEKLDKTIYCQPAILVTSLAAVEKLKDEKPWAIENCSSTAGFSSGEFASLVFSGALSFEDAVRVLKTRAQAMQEASEATSSGMMVVFLHPSAKLNFACHTARQYCIKRLGMEKAVCAIANYLYPECKVIAGNTEALEFIEKNAKDFGISRVKWLPVSGAFHTPLMQSAKKPLEEALKHVDIRHPIISVHSNVTSHRYNKPATIAKLLVEQVTSPVKWEQTLHVLYARPQGENFPSTYEMGPGTQLGSLLRKTNEKAHAHYSNITV
ncbi:hypothetical protein NP493_403g03017 [Ridgeia piscesae]|uniref:[acyl-carrier-protein] S-malonyltransferase n=1 Tax=Ridgeia piscesae TaxID=27915 RepID=A0AAD9NSN7_RIDPI|nr:hypothetical protein NP493_403g03017 [Ridgeia piscesae]